MPPIGFEHNGEPVKREAVAYLQGRGWPVRSGGPSTSSAQIARMIRYALGVPPTRFCAGRLRDLGQLSAGGSVTGACLSLLAPRRVSPSGINRIYRLYREERVTVPQAKGPERKAVGTRAADPWSRARPNATLAHWISSMTSSRRPAASGCLNVVDDVTRECLAGGPGYLDLVAAEWRVDLRPLIERPRQARHDCHLTTSYVGRSGCLGQQVMGHPVSRMPWIRLPRRALPSRNDLFHSQTTGYTRLWRPSPSSIRDPNAKQKARTLSIEVASCLPRLVQREVPSAWAHPLEEGAIGFAVIDHGVYGAAILAAITRVSLAAQMGVGVRDPLENVALELVAEACWSA